MRVVLDSERELIQTQLFAFVMKFPYQLQACRHLIAFKKVFQMGSGPDMFGVDVQVLPVLGLGIDQHPVQRRKRKINVLSVGIIR